MMGWSLRSQMIGVGECSLKGIFSNGDIFGIVCDTSIGLRRRMLLKKIFSAESLMQITHAYRSRQED